MIAAFTSPGAAALLRWIAFCAASLLVGTSAYHAVAERGLEAVAQRRLERLVRLAVTAILVAGIGRLAQQALSFAAEPSDAWGMVGILLGTPWGYAWVAQAIAALGVLARPALVASRPMSLAGSAIARALVAAIVVAPAFQGHAIGSPDFTALAVIGDIAHLLAAGTWMGTLFVIVAFALPQQDGGEARAMIGSFSPYALASAATLGATGVLASWLHVRHLPLLWGSAYGQVLLLKLALVAGVLALGAINWRRLTPHLLAPGGVARLGRSARGELLVAAAVFVVTAVLVATPLPNE